MALEEWQLYATAGGSLFLIIILYGLVINLYMKIKRLESDEDDYHDRGQPPPIFGGENTRPPILDGAQDKGPRPLNPSYVIPKPSFSRGWDSNNDDNRNVRNDFPNRSNFEPNVQNRPNFEPNVQNRPNSDYDRNDNKPFRGQNNPLGNAHLPYEDLDKYDDYKSNNRQMKGPGTGFRPPTSGSQNKDSFLFPRQRDFGKYY